MQDRDTIFAGCPFNLGERREIIVGHSDRRNLVLVSFVETDETVRLISARKATRTERENYEENTESQEETE